MSMQISFGADMTDADFVVMKYMKSLRFKYTITNHILIWLKVRVV